MNFKDIFTVEYSQSNATTANIVLRDLDLHYNVKHFLGYAFAIKRMYKQRMSPADLPRLARPTPWSCSCLLCKCAAARPGDAKTPSTCTEAY